MLNSLTKAHDSNLHTRLFSPYMGCTCSRVYEHKCHLSVHSLVLTDLLSAKTVEAVYVYIIWIITTQTDQAVTRCSLSVDTNVSEEYTASFFRVEVCRVGNF
jgi:hypothetical protein